MTIFSVPKVMVAVAVVFAIPVPVTPVASAGFVAPNPTASPVTISPGFAGLLGPSATSVTASKNVPTVRPPEAEVKNAGAYAAMVNGTGVVVSADGYVLTVNSHILDTQDLRVHTADGFRFHAKVVARTQPAKLAALEGHFKTGVADLYLFGWPDVQEQKVKYGLAIPGGLTFLVHDDFKTPIPGLEEFAPEDRPSIGSATGTGSPTIASASTGSRRE